MAEQLPTELTADVNLVEAGGAGSRTFLQKFNAIIRALKTLIGTDGTITGLTAAWTAYTPTVAATSGTITTKSATGRYKTVGKTTFITVTITITTNGTGSGAVTCTLPNTAAATFTLPGRETAVTGDTLQGVISGASMNIFTYTANGYPGANGRVLLLSGVYENT